MQPPLPRFLLGAGSLATRTGGGRWKEGAASWCCTLKNARWDWWVDLCPQVHFLASSRDFGEKMILGLFP